jgi:hypothetical protein
VALAQRPCSKGGSQAATHIRPLPNHSFR